MTKLGKGFFRNKCYKYLVHVPVIIRHRQRSGRNAGADYKRRDWLPVNELGATEKQVAQRVRQQVEAFAGPGRPHPAALGRDFFDSEGHWVVSTQYALQELQDGGDASAPAHEGLRSVSFQLPCKEDVLPSVFKDKPLCVPRQLAELLQLSVEEELCGLRRHAAPRLEAPWHKSSVCCTTRRCLAPPPQHLVLLRQLYDPCARLSPQCCAGLLMATWALAGGMSWRRAFHVRGVEAPTLGPLSDEGLVVVEVLAGSRRPRWVVVLARPRASLGAAVRGLPFFFYGASFFFGGPRILPGHTCRYGRE